MKSTIISMILGLVSVVSAAPDYPTNPAGNPFVSGLYADPDAGFFENQFWVYPSRSEDIRQTEFDAFSSPDLVHWTKHNDVLTKSDFKWAEKAFFAPSPVERNGSYYLFFSAQFPIGNGYYLDGIGIGKSDSPSGPFKDAINGTLVSGINNGAYSMDQQVFIDDDGQAYMYWGSGSHCNVAKLTSNLTALTPFPDGSTMKEITPDPLFVEGVYVFKRNGRYYMMWSEGLYGADSYSVAYGMSSSPLGPFKRIRKILESDFAVATGTGHNGLLHPPGTDIYYIVYHRHFLHYTKFDDRQLAYDRLHFNADGTIQSVQLLVHDNFDDGNMLGWTTYGGSWDASSGALVGDFSAGGKALLNTSFGDVGCDVLVTLPSGSQGGDAGLLFHVGDNVGSGQDSYQGYYAGISALGYVMLGRANQGQWTELAKVQINVSAGVAHFLRVRVTGDLIEVLVDDLSRPKISVHDGTYRSGRTGLRVFYTKAAFDNVVFEHI